MRGAEALGESAGNDAAEGAPQAETQVADRAAATEECCSFCAINYSGDPKVRDAGGRPTRASAPNTEGTKGHGGKTRKKGKRTGAGRG